MKLNPIHPGTYAGQEARIIVAAEMSDGRLLFALKTAAGTVATDFDRGAGAAQVRHEATPATGR